MGSWFFSEQEKWDEQIRRNSKGDWAQQALASRMEVCPKNPKHGGQGTKDRSPRIFPWDVASTEAAQRARSERVGSANVRPPATINRGPRPTLTGASVWTLVRRTQ
jgi:hypothetical protein